MLPQKAAFWNKVKESRLQIQIFLTQIQILK